MGWLIRSLKLLLEPFSLELPFSINGHFNSSRIWSSLVSKLDGLECHNKTASISGFVMEPKTYLENQNMRKVLMSTFKNMKWTNRSSSRHTIMLNKPMIIVLVIINHFLLRFLFRVCKLKFWIGKISIMSKN